MNGSGSDASTNSDGNGSDSSTDASPLLTPLVRWEFEGNTNNSGTVNGYALATPSGASYVTGKVGMAISFGAGQYSNVGGIRSLIGNLPKVTFALWIKEPGNLNSVSVLDVINRSTSPYGGVQLGFASNTTALCVATTTSSLLGAGCGGPTSPSANTWHHWIVRYNGTSTGGGGGGPTEIYVDSVLAYTQVNDTANNPVFTSTGISDTFSLGTSNVVVDDVKIFNTTYDLQTQCTGIIGGTWNGTACALP